jgi:hypothetical protein
MGGSEDRRIRAELWNDAVSAADYEDGRERYQAAIMEQWKLYVEMADRISNRRGLTNTFFLTLNTAIFTLIGVLAKESSDLDSWVLVFPLIVVLGECAAWWWLVRSYRQLNSAKFVVVGLLEKRLPASPFSTAEWNLLGEGKDWRKYLPLTHLEQWLPILFALVYLIGFVVVVAS